MRLKACHFATIIIPLNLFSLTTFTKAVLTAGALVALTAFTKAKAAGTLNFYPERIRSIDFDGLTPVIQLGLAIQNPSSSAFTLKALTGNIIANGIMIGSVSIVAPVYVRPISTSMVILSVRMSIFGVVNDIIKAFQNQAPQQTITLKAWANVDNYTTPITITYKVP